MNKQQIAGELVKLAEKLAGGKGTKQSEKKLLAIAKNNNWLAKIVESAQDGGPAARNQLRLMLQALEEVYNAGYSDCLNDEQHREV